MPNALPVVGGPTQASELIGVRGRTVTAGAGGIAAKDIVYLSAADTVLKADCDAASTMPAAGICPSAISAAATGDMVTFGVVTGLTGLTAGDPIYVSGTAGGYTQTKPTGAQLVQCIGYALTTTVAFFNFDQSGIAYLNNKSEGIGNWLRNAAFEMWEAGTTTVPDYWETGGTATFSRSTTALFGAYACQIQSSTGDGSLFQLVGSGATTNGEQIHQNYFATARTYTFAAWVKSDSNAVYLRMGDSTGANFVSSDTHSGGNGWERLKCTKVLSTSATYISCYLLGTPNGATVTIDGATLVEGTVDPGFVPSAWDGNLVAVRDVAIAAGGTTPNSVTGLPRRPKAVQCFVGNGAASIGTSVGMDNTYRAANPTLWVQALATDIPWARGGNDYLFFVGGQGSGTYQQGTALTFTDDGISWTNGSANGGYDADIIFVFWM